MKYIISESRLNEFIKAYLDTWSESQAIMDHDSFILIQEPVGDSDDTPYDYMEFDDSDKTLWINRGFYNNISDLFGMDQDQAGSFIKNWFENRFDVSIDSLR